MKPGGEGLADAGSNSAKQALDGDDNQLVASVARALNILNSFHAGDGPLGNAQLAQRTQLTRPTVSRLTYTLARCGYLSFDPRFRVYELGPSAKALGNVAMSSMDVRQLAKPLIQELARQANFNVGLGTLEDQMMVYSDAFEGDGLVGLRLFAGSRIPVVTSGMGRAYLAGLEPSEREALLNELKPQYGSEWPTLQKAVGKAVREVEQFGFCASIGEWQKDINGVAAPIRSSSGGRLYAVNLGGPAYLLREDTLRSELGPRIAQLARQVESAMSPKASKLPNTLR